MAIILQFDETSGAQSLTNDVFGVQGVTIPTQLNTELSTIFSSTGANPIEIGFSGSAGGSTGVVANFGANVIDVGFTDSAGAALNGLDSGLRTIGGSPILLYSQSNNNVVYGRVGSSSGVIAFVLYLDTGVDTGSADPSATSAKLWMVQYTPLEHRDEPGGAPNEVEYLKDKLYVAANALQEFSLSGAPSGQNLFLMFGDGTPSATDATIVVTGKNPSITGSVTEGDTVNTGQGGGTTTIGSNNQMVDPGEGMYFTFVKGANVDYTVPNLDQNEADVAANIQFDTYFGATSASFAVVQMQPPKGATLRITAIDNKGTTEKQMAFLQGLAPIANANESLDEFIDVTSVSVTRAIKTGKTVTLTTIAFAPGDGAKNGITVDFTGDTARITGLEAGDQVTYTTAALHNRVLIDNVGNANANLNSAFDIGKFRLESSVQARTALADVAIYDDNPTITATLVGAPAPTVDESALGTDDSDSFAAQFTPDYGRDGAAASSPVTYALSTVGGDSGVVDSATGTAVYLFLQSGQVVGRVGNNAAGAIVFVVSVDASGNVGLDQQRAIMHTPNTGADQSLSLSGTNLVVLTATATDKDGDTASAPLDITSRITMKDDGPSITGTLVGAPTPTVDESALATDDSDSFAAQFTPVYGADGAAAASPVTYALSTSGGDSGLIDSATGTGIFLFLQSGVINGRVGNNAAGAIAFVVGVDGSGNVSLDQRSAIMHTPNTGPDQSLTMTGTNMVVLTATATDKDGDTASAPLDITARLTFKDDAPTLAFGNVVGTGTALAQYGAWTPNAGADNASATPGLDITQAGFRLTRPNGTTTASAPFTLTEDASSPDGSGAYHFTGSVTADFDNDGNVDANPRTFTLTAFADGRYNIDLTAGFGSSVTSFKTSDGLGAGGPDPVQTLYIPNQTSPVETIVFFSAKVSATTSQIQSGIGIATPPNADFDPTEAQLETNPLPAYVDPRNMNVSTSGIGVANNILQGDSNAAITDVDESFVVNAKSLLTSVKVFIDNSVGGYTPATEDLYFRAYYSDGTFTALTDVTAGMLSNEAGNQKSFTITREGSKLIDAVQLVMGRGDVKIPVIEFVRESVSLASDLQLDFNASYTDKDGDAATSSFSAALLANELGTGPDYLMTGESGQRDDFNIDLSTDRDAYEIAGWDAGGVNDAMVLLASTGATFAIDNTGANAVVTITEAGGQQTVVTVIGVDVDNADVLLVGT